MKALAALMLLVMTVGCDNPTVKANIIDYFVCSYMPWWMGDCQSPEVVAKVESVLDHGLVEAQIECITGVVQGTHPVSLQVESSNPDMRFSYTMLQDSMVLVLTASASDEYPSYSVRGMFTRGHAPSGLTVQVAPSRAARFNGGFFQVTNPNHGQPGFYLEEVLGAWPIAEVCTGFNLEAFGALP